VKENETLVEVTPRIRGVGAPICNFRIVNKHHGEAPFEVSSPLQSFAH
jgi:calsyntenin 1